MADNMCGPSGGLKDIKRHFDGNRSEQRDRINNAGTGLQHPFAEHQQTRQDAAFTSFQQGTASLADAIPTNTMLGSTFPGPSPSSFRMPNQYVPVHNTLPVPNAMPNAQLQGHNIADVNQHFSDYSTGSFNQAHPGHPGHPVQAGPSSGPPATCYPLNHHPTPGMMLHGTQFSYRPMPTFMAGGMPFDSVPSPLQYQQPQAANATSTTDDFDFDAELSAWMERNSLQDQPQASEKLQEGTHNSSEDQTQVPEEVPTVVEAKTADTLNQLDNQQEASPEPVWVQKLLTPDSLIQTSLGYEEREAIYQHSIRACEITKRREQGLISSSEQDELAQAERKALEAGMERIRQDRIRNKRRTDEDAELASAAQGLLNAVSTDDSNKFKNSQFLGLLRHVAAQKLVVRDNKLVDPDALPTEGEGEEGESKAPH
ncbi:hypothetical protein F5Y13DRAFT_167233 [Hypoxylon sp. FL1857]|nr:hypothetical protein F5Y13DRAFT_167233 [Hypoxylon sp. FL1857]